MDGGPDGRAWVLGRESRVAHNHDPPTPEQLNGRARMLTDDLKNQVQADLKQGIAAIQSTSLACIAMICGC